MRLSKKRRDGVTQNYCDFKNGKEKRMAFADGVTCRIRDLWLIAGICGLVFAGIGSISAHESKPKGDKLVTAVPLPKGQKIALDGLLDEPIWRVAIPGTDFIQRELEYGAPATQESEFRFCFDEETLYVGIRCFDDQPSGIRMPTGRSERDMNAGDVVNIFIDSRHDHRTGYKLSVSPSGMRSDNSRYNDYLRDDSWDGFWWAESRIDSLGWTAEMRVPFKNFRFEQLESHTWGLQIERKVARLYEQSFWKQRDLDDGRFIRMSKLAHLVGFEGIRTGRRVEIVPYGLAGLARSDATSTSSTKETGFDIKYAVTPGLTLDATLNPDFAQVDADLDEVNLTRFPTRFAELRPFFVEGNNAFLTPIELFYSRRIGGRTDILGGGKVSGKIGPYTVGAIAARTGDWTYFGLEDDDASKEDATFGILRLKRDIFS